MVHLTKSTLEDQNSILFMFPNQLLKWDILELVQNYPYEKLFQEVFLNVPNLMMWMM